MMRMIKIHGLQDVEKILGILIKNGYTCEAKAVYKKFPEERDIDYFRIFYWSDEGDEQDE